MKDDMTPMMRQYRRIKRQLPADVILFFRLGDFYEMFFEDAVEAASILDIALTKRHTAPMCGVPYHSVDAYVGKLMRAGKKVAICDQTEDPAFAKGIVKREVTRIVTPGTVTEEHILDAERHNFLAAVCPGAGSYGVAFLDLSTGLFFGMEAANIESVREGICQYTPSECIVPAEQADAPLEGAVAEGGPAGSLLTRCDDWIFEYETARDVLLRHFGAHSLDGYGCEGKRAVVSAAGGILHYVKDQLRRELAHVRSFHVKSASDSLILDEATRVNLDLVPGLGRKPSPTLFDVLNVARTAMGVRKLREWIVRPLARLSAIELRHDAVGAFCRDRMLLRDVRDALGAVKDLERLMTRIESGSGNARDIAATAGSLEALPGLQQLLQGSIEGQLVRVRDAAAPRPALVNLAARAIADEPPISIRDGGLIRDGYSGELDELRRAGSEGRKWLSEYQAKEQKRTGIKTLKVRYNRVFGYYIEISRGQAEKAPDDYARKQTLVNAERFITPELKDYESRILGAQEKAAALESEIFEQVRAAFAAESAAIHAAADALAELDALAALADRAAALRYVRPVMTDGDRIEIRGGRHPIVERMSDAEKFVPNDTLLDCSENQLAIITGPNMAGKSTYIRQVALIVIMAQMGSFVPADKAVIGVVDRVFTRVGASDDLARGRSTFMVEMQETANILNNATPASLIVLDEIGRGTSTFDGISIAWAVAEHLHGNSRVGAKTLFATHYHELTDLALTMKGVKNYNVLVREQNDKVVFLRKIAPGASDKSYGIQVARLAGLPPDVIERAKEILANLEEGEIGETGQPQIARKRTRKGTGSPDQLQLFRGH